MTRASEFCYIAERADGAYLMGIGHAAQTYWTRDENLALRIADRARGAIAQAAQISTPRGIGFRKVIAG